MLNPQNVRSFIEMSRKCGLGGRIFFLEVELEAMALFSLPFHKDYHSAAGVLARWFEEFASHVSHFWEVLIFCVNLKENITFQN